MHDLLVDLRGGKRPRETTLSGRTEHATHCATCLRRGADGEAVLRGHADALHGDAVGETKQVLAAAIARELTGYLRRATKAEALGKLLAERLGDVRHVIERGDVLRPDPLSNLLCAKAGLAEGRDELLDFLRVERAQVGARTRRRARWLIVLVWLHLGTPL